MSWRKWRVSGFGVVVVLKCSKERDLSQVFLGFRSITYRQTPVDILCLSFDWWTSRSSHRMFTIALFRLTKQHIIACTFVEKKLRKSHESKRSLVSPRERSSPNAATPTTTPANVENCARCPTDTLRCQKNNPTHTRINTNTSHAHTRTTERWSCLFWILSQTHTHKQY